MVYIPSIHYNINTTTLYMEQHMVYIPSIHGIYTAYGYIAYYNHIIKENNNTTYGIMVAYSKHSWY